MVPCTEVIQALSVKKASWNKWLSPIYGFPLLRLPGQATDTDTLFPEPPADRQSYAPGRAFTSMNAVGVCSLSKYFRVWEAAPTASVLSYLMVDILAACSKSPSTRPGTELRIADIYRYRLILVAFALQPLNSFLELFPPDSCPQKDQGRYWSCRCRGAKAQPRTTLQASSGARDGALR